MKPNSAATHKVGGLVVEVSPSEVDAAAELRLTVKASCSPALDLKGLPVLIKDQDGIEIGRTEFAKFDGATSATGEIVLKAPAKAGAYAWWAVCPAASEDDFSFDEAAATFAFTVKAHATRMVIWEVPSALRTGEKFTLRVGMKCTGECRLTGREFEVYDHEGAKLATATLGEDTWPETSLYFAEMELAAPAAEGLHQWEAQAPAAMIKVPGSEDDLPHEAGSATFGVRSVPAPEFVVRVEAIDKAKQVPLQGARVVMHPYAATTDDHGVAEIRVPRGQYSLQVSRKQYRAVGIPIEVMADVATKAELDLEPIVDPGDMYY